MIFYIGVETAVRIDRYERTGEVSSQPKTGILTIIKSLIWPVFIAWGILRLVYWIGKTFILSVFRREDRVDN